jgi:hypothetical protein
MWNGSEDIIDSGNNRIQGRRTMHRSHRLTIYLSVLLISVIVSCNRQQSEWGGSVGEADGVTVVQNPIEPLYGEDVLQLEEELSIGEAEGREEYMFGGVRDLAILPNGNIYVLDYRKGHIKIFNRQGQYLETIGKPGQGPGELNRPRSLCIRGDVLFVPEASRQISVFSISGEFEKRISTKDVWALLTRATSSGNFLVTSGVIDPEYIHYSLTLYDGDMNLIKEIATSPAPDARKGFDPFMAIAFWTLGKDDMIIYGYPKDFELQIFDPDGNLIRKIRKDYDPVEVTDEEKEEYENDSASPPNLTFSKYHSAFRRLFADDQGRIFVETWEKTEDDADHFYDVFDQDGKYILKTTLPNRPRCCLDGMLYTIEEDEDGYQYVKRYRVTWSY